MARPLYDFLTDSILFDPEHLGDRYRQVSNDRLQKELADYREHLQREKRAVEAELQESGGYSVYIDSLTCSQPPIALIKQCGLYFDRIVVDDPLYAATVPEYPVDKGVGQYLGFEPRSLDRDSIARRVGLLKELAPAVAEGVVTLAPFSAAHERGPTVPIRYSETLFVEDLPRQHVEWIHQKARVSPLRRNEDRGSWYTIPGEEIESPCRAISVDFGEPGLALVYFLLKTEVVDFDEETGICQFRQWLAEEMPDEGEFRAWVLQSINQAGRAVISRILGGLVNCQATRSVLLTTSSFVSEFVGREVGDDNDLGSKVAELALKLEVPVLSDLSVQSLIRIRSNNDRAFRSFRLAVQRCVKELARIEDREELARRLKETSYDLTELRVAEVDQEIGRIRKEVLTESALGVASLAVAIPTKGLSLAALLLAGIEGHKSASKLRRAVKANPGYFLWKLQKETAKK